MRKRAVLSVFMDMRIIFYISVELALRTIQPVESVSRIHVRRTDKTSEAKYHILEEYMVYVEEWFDAYEYLHKEIVRKIYLATDEPKLLDEARTK